MFQSLGLRHLVVVNEFNEPCGMITRKDLLGQTIEERIAHKLLHPDSFQFWVRNNENEKNK